MIDEDKKLIYEFCGLKQLTATDEKLHWFDSRNNIISPIDENGNPIRDLNFYFKHAVPKGYICGVTFRHYPGGTGCILTTQDEAGFTEISAWLPSPSEKETFDKADERDALAFGQALLKLIEAGG